MTPPAGWRPLGYAAAGGAVLGAVLAWQFLPPKVNVKTETVEKVVVRWKTREAIDTKAGAVVTVTRAPDGTETTRIEGPATIGRESEGSATRLTESRMESIAAAWTWAVSAGALLPRPALQAGVDYRIGRLFFLDVGVGLVGEWPVGSYIPTRGGARLVLTW